MDSVLHACCSVHDYIKAKVWDSWDWKDNIDLQKRVRLV